MKTLQLKILGQLLMATFLFTGCSNNDNPAEENLALEIGQDYQGGIIFYLDDSGEHGLIAYQSDLAEAPWGCVSYPDLPSTSIAQNNGIGFGEQNTLAIINFCDEPNIAARLAYTLDGNGYADWYLPSIDELALIYENRDFIGGFPDLSDPNNIFIYASSSEGLASEDGNGGFYYLSYFVCDFSDTTVFPNARKILTSKINSTRVRPIRSF